MKIIIALLIGAILSFVPSSVITYAREPTPLEYVYQFADEYGVNADMMIKIMNCENAKWDSSLQSYYVKNGVREDSWGLVQIHLPSHPEITKAQATDPEFSIEFLARSLSQGKAKWWTCYRILKKKGVI